MGANRSEFQKNHIRSIVIIEREFIKNRRSKNNRIRKFPCYPQLTELLRQLHDARSNKLVFPAKNGKPIDYDNFARSVWNKMTQNIVARPSTPYSARDTFITEQLGLGKPIAIVAKWVDNSPQMIESRYLDMSAIVDILPG